MCAFFVKERVALIEAVLTDYEQQRKELLKKHGIDLDDPNGIADGKKTKKMNPRDIEKLMGTGDGEGGIFTWREKNRKKACSLSSMSEKILTRCL